MAQPTEGRSAVVQTVELPFAEDSYPTVCEAISTPDDALHIPMWRAILQHIEDELEG